MSSPLAQFVRCFTHLATISNGPWSTLVSVLGEAMAEPLRSPTGADRTCAAGFTLVRQGLRRNLAGHGLRACSDLAPIDASKNHLLRNGDR